MELRIREFKIWQTDREEEIQETLDIYWERSRKSVFKTVLEETEMERTKGRAGRDEKRFSGV